MSSTSKLLKVLLRLLVLLGVVGFLIVGAAENGGRKMKNGLLNARAAAAGNMKQHVEGNMGREKHSRALSKFDLNYTSKRRIPNGPDPIHNRRAGNSRQPPGQA
ncbi:hypothetical protein Pfo_009451 [Paulownia fortunei]|nr:hypothetical protein Pfo_009451 [Paulownia fortunei]